MSKSHEDIQNHIHRLQVEVEHVRRVAQQLPPSESCKDELEEIYQSVSSLMAALKADLLNLSLS
jgi:hypothetical protein